MPYCLIAGMGKFKGSSARIAGWFNRPYGLVQGFKRPHSGLVQGFKKVQARWRAGSRVRKKFVSSLLP